MIRMAVAFIILGLGVSGTVAAGLPSGKQISCGITRTQAIEAYRDWVTIEGPNRIRALDRGKYWLVFQRSILPKPRARSLNSPAPGAHHIAKVNKCDGSILPYDEGK